MLGFRPNTAWIRAAPRTEEEVSLGWHWSRKIGNWGPMGMGASQWYYLTVQRKDLLKDCVLGDLLSELPMHMSLMHGWHKQV